MAKITLSNGVVFEGTVSECNEFRLQMENQKAPKSGRGNNKVVEAPKTKREAINEWASKKYSEAERKAYGEKKRAERELQKKAYEAANKKFKEKVGYDVWKAEYEKQLKKLSK